MNELAKHKISTVIITLNEERNLEDCLKSVVSFSDEIVIVDSGSSDKTPVIANNFSARFLINPFAGHIQQKNFANQSAANNWIFSLDADERVSPQLAEKINQLKNSGFSADGYRVNRLNFFLYDWYRKGGWYPDRKTRLVNRQIFEWQGENPHDALRPKPGRTEPVKIENLPLDLYHFTYRSLDEHILQINRFSRIAAQHKREKIAAKYPESSRRKTNLIYWKILWNPLIKFFDCYFRKGSFTEGWRGFIFSVMASFSVFMKYAKLWELETNSQRTNKIMKKETYI